MSDTATKIVDGCSLSEFITVATKKILSLAARDDFVSAELSGDGDSVVLVMKFSKKSCEVCTFGRVVWR